MRSTAHLVHVVLAKGNDRDQVGAGLQSDADEALAAAQDHVEGAGRNLRHGQAAAAEQAMLWDL